MTLSIYSSVIPFDELLHFCNSIDNFNGNICKKNFKSLMYQIFRYNIK